jgi:hypothetical protein
MFFQCVVLDGGSSLASLEVKMENCRHLNGHQFTVKKVAGHGNRLFRSLAFLTFGRQ